MDVNGISSKVLEGNNEDFIGLQRKGYSYCKVLENLAELCSTIT